MAARPRIPNQPRTAIGALLVAIIVAGCVDAGGASTGGLNGFVEGGEARYDDANGAIEGLVTDEEIVGLPDVLVNITDVGATARSDALGKFAFSFVPPGSFRLRLEKDGYAIAEREVTVSASHLTSVTIQLERLPAPGARHVTAIQPGLLPCGAVVRVANEYGGFSAACPALQLGDNRSFSNRWKISGPVPEWNGAALETDWRSTQAFGAGLLVEWSAEGCRSPILAEPRGRAPLRVLLDGPQIDSAVANYTAASCDNSCTVDGCALRSIVFSWPDTFGSASAVDVGITWQQGYVQYLTEFYNQPMPPKFSAIADG